MMILIGRSGTSRSTFPWMCSLKEAGFRGRHKCGVTLLSGEDASNGRMNLKN